MDSARSCSLQADHRPTNRPPPDQHARCRPPHPD
ncbi:hypothetical protein E2C01_075920 [Portunus trituberculatus]|uniref:Uncharacterized protein n=1 Tax=Portunus trituberculatus TaxID=210409 RepID=A0A5B7ILU6_PORTR|nr:hypothetical protein [Portunus trituberculatus]